MAEERRWSHEGGSWKSSQSNYTFILKPFAAKKLAIRTGDSKSLT